MSERRMFLGLGAGLFLVVLAVYISTMAGSTSFWDCGEFIATAYSLGIPHPPATPLYVVLGRAFSLLPLPFTVPQKVNFMSAFFGALGIVVLYVLIVDLIRERRGTPRTPTDRVVVYGSAALGALFTAWSNTYWSNSVEAEVYSISSFVMGMTTILARRWARAPESADSTRAIYLIIYLLSLGVGFHLGTVLTYPAIALYVLLARKKSFQDADFVIFSGGFFLFLFHVNLKQPDGILLALLLLVFAVAFGVRAAAGKRFVPVATGLFLLGLSIHLFLLIRSNQNPAIDEADPETWRNLLAVLRREQYPPSSVFVRKASWHFQIVDHFWRYFREQYEFVHRDWSARILPGWVPGGGVLTGRTLAALPILIGLAGIVSIFRSNRRTFVLVFVTFLITSFGMIVFLNFSDAEVRERDYFYSPAFYFFGIFIGVGAAALIDYFFRTRPGERASRFETWGSVAAVAVLLLLTSMLYERYRFEHDRTQERVPWGYGYNMLAGLEPDALIFTNGDNDTFPLWYQQEVEQFRRDVRVINLSLLNTTWYVRQLKENDPKVVINWSDAQIEDLQGQITREGRVLQPRDLAVRQIVRDNYGKRPIYFAVTIPRDGLRDVEDYLVQEGLVHRMTDTKGKDRRDYERMEKNATAVYRYDGILRPDGKRDESVYRDPNQRSLVGNYAGAFIRLAQHAEEQADQTADETVRQGLYQKAVDGYRTALEISPDIEVLKAQLGTVYIKMGQGEAAADLYEDVVRANPGDDRWLFQYVQALFAVGRVDEGVARLREVAQRSPNEQYVHEFLVQVLVEMGRTAEAESAVAAWEAGHAGNRGLRDFFEAAKAGLVPRLLGSPTLPVPGAVPDTGRR